MGEHSGDGRMAGVEPEIERIRQYYSERDASKFPDLYSRLDPYADYAWRERERVLVRLLRQELAAPSLENLTCIEVGCGNGANLLQLLSLGFRPQNLIGSELVPARAEAARQRLPSATRIMTGDAVGLAIGAEKFDLVYQSTVFSSLLDDDFQMRLADAMWDWLQPGGAVLWYDFIVGNPANAGVRGVSRRRVAQLFPRARVRAVRVTLAPPVGRALSRISPGLPGLANRCMPLLRTHLWAWIAKPVNLPPARSEPLSRSFDQQRTTSSHRHLSPMPIPNCECVGESVD